MQRSRFAFALAGVTLIAGCTALPAAADDQSNDYPSFAWSTGRDARVGSNDLIVRRRAYSEPVAPRS